MKSKYDKIIRQIEDTGVAPVFSRSLRFDIESTNGLAVRRIRAIMLAASTEAAANIREIRLSSKIKPKDALAKVAYNEATGVLTISKESAKDPTDGGKYTTGKQLSYALELERRRARRKDKTITKEDRAAARKVDLVNSAGTLYDEKALEDVP